MKNSPIIVSGSHRSGSTWIGRIISTANDVRYIDEPFNIAHNRNFSPVNFWFEYIDNETDLGRRDEILHYLKSFYSLSPSYLLDGLSDLNRLENLLPKVNDLFKRTYCRPLYKDPLMIMSLPWVADALNADVLVSIRHPAAFVASIMVKNWTFDFKNITNQPRLLSSLEPKYVRLVNMFSEKPQGIIDQGILLWNIIHTRIVEYQKCYGPKSSWVFVRHEDISTSPSKEFKRIFVKFGLKFSKKIEEKIIETTKSTPDEYITRNSQENIKNWKRRLSLEDIEKIKSQTEHVWRAFYTEQSW